MQDIKAKKFCDFMNCVYFHSELKVSLALLRILPALLILPLALIFVVFCNCWKKIGSSLLQSVDRMLQWDFFLTLCMCYQVLQCLALSMSGKSLSTSQMCVHLECVRVLQTEGSIVLGEEGCPARSAGHLPL